MACDLHTLVRSTQPWSRYGHKMILTMRILVLCDLINGSDCSGSNDVESLAFRANCLSHLSESQLEGIEIQLMCAILNSGGGGGGTSFQQVYQSNGDPNGVILVNTTKPCLCIDLDNHIIWSKTDGVVSNTGWGSP